MNDSDWSAEALRRRINQYRPYSGAHIEVTHVAEDLGEIRVRMPLLETNANLVGTHFGGSLYAMGPAPADPQSVLLGRIRFCPETAGYSSFSISGTGMSSTSPFKISDRRF